METFIKPLPALSWCNVFCCEPANVTALQSVFAA
jgi:hypothetical protein